MNLSCIHSIKWIIENSREKYNQTHIDYIHSHWRFRKSSIEILIENFEIHEFQSNHNIIVETLNVSKENFVNNVTKHIIAKNTKNYDLNYEFLEFERFIRERLNSNNNIDFSVQNVENEKSSIEFIVRKMKNDNHIEASIEKIEKQQFEIEWIVKNMKNDNLSETSIEEIENVEKNLKIDDLFDVNEFVKVKTKKRSREIKNKKASFIVNQKRSSN